MITYKLSLMRGKQMIKYKACDFFMIRTPLMSIDDYLSMFCDPKIVSQRLSQAFASPILKEATLRSVLYICFATV